MKKPRSLVVLGMILTRKAKVMNDRRDGRGGARNRQLELMKEAEL